jgi:hypothetical protein
LIQGPPLLSSDAGLTDQQKQVQEEPIVRLTGNFVVWHLRQSTFTEQNADRTPTSNSIAVFGSILLADGALFVPSIKLLTFVDVEHVTAAQKLLSLRVDIHEMILANVRQVVFVPIDSGQRVYLTSHNTDYLKQLRRRFPSLSISITDDKEAVCIAAPHNVTTLVESLVRRHLDKIASEDVTVQVRTVEPTNCGAWQDGDVKVTMFFLTD